MWDCTNKSMLCIYNPSEKHNNPEQSFKRKYEYTLNGPALMEEREGKITAGRIAFLFLFKSRNYICNNATQPQNDQLAILVFLFY